MSEEGLKFPVGDDGFDAEATLTNILGLYSFQFEKHIKRLGDAKHIRRLIIAMIAKPTSGTSLELEPVVVETLKLAEDAKNEREGAIVELTAKLGELSTGELKRLANALVQYPFSHKLYIQNYDSDSLKNAYAIGQKMLEAKNLYLQMTLMQIQSEQQNQQTTDVASEQNPVDDGVKPNE